MSCARCGPSTDSSGGGGGGSAPPSSANPGADGMDRLRPARVVDTGSVEDTGPALDPRMLIFAVLVAWAAWSELTG